MNKDLSVSIINLIDGIKDNLERRIGGLSFREFADEALLPIEEDNDGVISDNVAAKKHNYELAMILLGETTKNGYNRIREK